MNKTVKNNSGAYQKTVVKLGGDFSNGGKGSGDIGNIKQAMNGSGHAPNAAAATKVGKDMSPKFYKGQADNKYGCDR